MPEHYQVIYATTVFLLTYAAIVSEKIHRTVAAFIGAGLVVIAGIVTPETAVHAITAYGFYGNLRRTPALCIFTFKLASTPVRYGGALCTAS